jgi:hypothetical protein
VINGQRNERTDSSPRHQHAAAIARATGMTLYPLPDVAARLHKSPRWLQCYLRERPFGRMAGRTRLFTESDILALIESLPCPSSSSSATAQT